MLIERVIFYQIWPSPTHSEKNYKKNTANVHILVELQIHLIHLTDPNCVSIGNGCFLADPLCERYINLYLNDN